MKAHVLARDDAAERPLAGMILCEELRAPDGRLALHKGRRLAESDLPLLFSLPWPELHLLELEPGELHEGEAGRRLASAVAGEGIHVGAYAAGHWPLLAERRGLLDVDVERLRRVNQVEGSCVYTLYDGQVVDAGEVVAHAKITPFALPERALATAEATAREAAGLVRVRAFHPTVVGAVVEETLEERRRERFVATLREKLDWFGSTLRAPVFAPRSDVAIADALLAEARGGCGVIVAAGARALDPLDPMFRALARLDVRLERYGVPAHPGSLFWLARLEGVPILGMPSCGLFSQATSFDLILPRVLAGRRVDAASLAELGHGGLLGREMAFRFPLYRAGARRGELQEA